MAALADQANHAEDPEFVRRVRQAMVKAAIAVAAEDPSTAGHARRIALASAVVALPNAWAANFAIGVATNGNVGTGVSDPLIDDSALEYVTNSLWNAFTWV